MLTSILSLLLDLAASLIGGACLVRAYMHWQRMPLSVAHAGPLGQFIKAITDWIVLPLRRALPPRPNLDSASVLAAYLLLLAQYTLLTWLSQWFNGGLVPGSATLLSLPLVSLFALLRLVLSIATGLLIAYAIMSWVQPASWLMLNLHRLAAPLLRPLQRLVPRVGGVDLSVLVAIVVLQVAGIVLAHLQGWLLPSLLA